MATHRMPALPSLGKSAASIHPCICGCGMGTRRTWYPGHDGRATGWAVRIEKGILTLDEVPANERKGAEYMLLRRTKESEAIAKASKTA